MRLLFIAASLFYSTCVLASNNKTPLLDEADILIENAPKTSLEVAKDYLYQRISSDLPQIHLSGNDHNSSIKELLDTVQAYFISARANIVLENEQEAWEALAKARYLIEENGLNYALLELNMLEASIHFYLEENQRAAKEKVEKVLSNIPAKSNTRPYQLNELAFEANLLYAILYANEVPQSAALSYFKKAQDELGDAPPLLNKIYYQIALGNYFLNNKLHEKALSELLSAYWLASENDYTAQIARANVALARLFRDQGIFDQAIEHANQAAEYYERHMMGRALSDTQLLLGDAYYLQGRYNFALVHYFNAMDIENTFDKTPASSANVLVSIANTYFRMEQIHRAEKYLEKAISLAKNHDDKTTLTDAYLLDAEIKFTQKKHTQAISSLEKTVTFATDEHYKAALLKALPLLSQAYEAQNKFKLSLNAQRHFERLNVTDDNAQKSRDAESFKHSQQAIERQLLLEDMQRQHREDSQLIVEQKQVNLFLIATIWIVLAILFLRHQTARKRLKQLQVMHEDIYMHPRSKLRNLLMLNEKLAVTLAEKCADFEKWYLSEMIHQPYTDKLRFAMFEVPFLQTVYLKYGYKQGLKLEEELGEFFKEYIHEPARLYHFSDAMFIYIEPNSNSINVPEWLHQRIQSLVDNFVYQASLRSADNKIHLGMADIPFLPRAVTRIGDTELIEILLMATNAARQAAKEEKGSQWVHLSAIDSTPAAYFAKTNVREACLKGINLGFIKVKTSAIQGINWQSTQNSPLNPPPLYPK